MVCRGESETWATCSWSSRPCLSAWAEYLKRARSPKVSRSPLLLVFKLSLAWLASSASIHGISALPVTFHPPDLRIIKGCPSPASWWPAPSSPPSSGLHWRNELTRPRSKLKSPRSTRPIQPSTDITCSVQMGSSSASWTVHLRVVVVKVCVLLFQSIFALSIWTAELVCYRFQMELSCQPTILHSRASSVKVAPCSWDS